MRLPQILLTASLFASACTPAETVPIPATGPPNFEQIYTEILKPSCSQSACHGGPTGIAGLSFETLDVAFAQLVGAASVNGPATTKGLLRVDPWAPDNSLLLVKMAKTNHDLAHLGYGVRMPMASDSVLADGTLVDIKAWIDAGALKDGPAGILDVSWVPTPEESGYIDCAATEDAAMRDCFPAADPDTTKTVRYYSPPLVLEPNSEELFCSFLDVNPETLLVRRASGMQMNGGHHAGVFVSVVHREVGTSVPCDEIDMSSLRFVIGAGGAGGLDTNLNEGLALRVRKGEQIVIQSHYINTDATPRTVMDAVDIELSTLADSPVIADSFAMIDSGFEIPVGAKGFTRVKDCLIDRNIQLHMMIGHTHDYGSLFELEIIHQGQEPILQYHATDGPQLRDNPEIQTFLEPITLVAGDKLRMTCSWDNTTDHVLTWPEEMCVTFMYYTPGDGWMTCDTPDETPQIVGAAGGGCRLLGDLGNDKGVGEYCTPDGEQCGDNASATFCLASFSDVNNYCSIILCEEDAQCGEGASCVVEGPGSACILDICDEEAE